MNPSAPNSPSSIKTQPTTTPTSPETATMLIGTKFLGKPLFINDHTIPMSSTACPNHLPSANEFTAYRPDIGHVTDRQGRRTSLFLRIKKLTLSFPVYEKPALPAISELAEELAKLPPQQNFRFYERYATTVDTPPPQNIPSTQTLSKSGLFITPPSSPTDTDTDTDIIVPPSPSQRDRDMSFLWDANPSGRLVKICPEKIRTAYQPYRPRVNTEVNEALVSFDDVVQWPFMGLEQDLEEP